MTTPTRRRATALVAALAALAAFAVPGCARSDAAAPVPVNQPSRADTRTTDEVPFELSWRLQLALPPERAWVVGQDAELLLVQLPGDHALYAIDSLSGATRWVSQPLPAPIQGEPCFTQIRNAGSGNDGLARIDERLYVISEDTLVSIDVATGQVVWRFTLPFAPSTGPLAVGTEDNLRVYVGDWTDRVQVVTIHPERRFPYVLWQWPLSSAMISAAVEHDQLVYAADRRGAIACLKLDRGAAWTAQTGGSVEGGVCLRGLTLFAGNENHVVVAINALTGERLGYLNVDAPVRRRPFVFAGEPDRVYAWTDDDKQGPNLISMTARSDRVALGDEQQRAAAEVVRMSLDWRSPGLTTLVGSTPLHLFVTNGQDLAVKAVHRGTGRIVWTWDVAAGWPGSAKALGLVSFQDRTDRNRSLYAWDANGLILSWRVNSFVPTVAEEAAGRTTRALVKPAAKPAAAKPDAAAAPAPEAELPK